MLTTPEITTVHVMGKCPVKGCTGRKRHTTTGIVKRDRYGARTSWGFPAPAPYDTVSPNPNHVYTPPSKFKIYGAFETAYMVMMTDAGWICTEHDRFYVWHVIKGTVNEDKPCSSKCRGAVGPSCECVCGGALHGAQWG